MNRRDEDDIDVKMAIDIANFCDMFSCLPGPGGVMDQDPLLLVMVREVMAARAEKMEMEGKRRGP